MVYDSIGDANLAAASAGTTNFPSLGFQARSIFELGNGVILTSDEDIASVQVMMSSWACETGAWNTGDCLSSGSTFSVPITLTIYDATSLSGVGAPPPGSILHQAVTTFPIPFRPSFSPTCSGGRWRDFSCTPTNVATGDPCCFNGFPHVITFTVPSVSPPSSKQIVWSVSFSTQSYGFPPLGGASNQPVNSLNVAVGPHDTTGLLRPSSSKWVYGSSTTQSFCTPTTSTPPINVFVADEYATTPCYTPMARITTVVAGNDAGNE